MSKLVCDKVIVPHGVRHALQQKLGGTYSVSLKNNRVLVVQDGVRGCAILLREKDGHTVFSGPSGFMPSGWLRLAVVFGVFGTLFIIGLNIGYLVLPAGILPALLALLVMKLPSSELVAEVRSILEQVVQEAQQANGRRAKLTRADGAETDLDDVATALDKLAQHQNSEGAL